MDMRTMAVRWKPLDLAPAPAPAPAPRRHDVTGRHYTSDSSVCFRLLNYLSPDMCVTSIVHLVQVHIQKELPELDG